MLPLTPTKLGRYEIVDEIGKGAMGVVYLARDPLIGRLVALKTFRIGYSIRDQEMEQFRIRFMREAQSAGILSHPNIVTIHDVVEQTEDGWPSSPWSTCGGPTSRRCSRATSRCRSPFIADIVAQVAEALDYAHAHRVDPPRRQAGEHPDHRRQPGEDHRLRHRPARHLEPDPGGQLLGTPNYMAPEQIQGKDVDHRADLFALGVVLYEMLTRHKPFQGENLTVVSHRIVYDHFTPPKEYAQDLPPGVEQVLDRRPGEGARPAATSGPGTWSEDLRRIVAPSTVARDDLNETLEHSPPWAPAVPPLAPRGDAAGRAAPGDHDLVAAASSTHARRAACRRSRRRRPWPRGRRRSGDGGPRRRPGRSPKTPSPPADDDRRRSSPRS